ncbi:sodium/glutamate symporter [Natronincola ferrireducens]|uniref:Sodium/glutamate symporter n=1 Tax=Natronincola ferrireducens TaxID=393762 RepID=A0A1G8XMJ4_9FIRM|nr:sodium/glutamate symporter [Natronincola ferrireducens]SDJ91636.1 glutamate:Na+ symporter, ESS family [Natronincola ferrireducens]
MVLQLDIIQSVALAVVVLLLGQTIRGKVKVLEKFCIPAPVIGGLIFAILVLFLRQSNILYFEMDTTLQGILMTAFFTTVGFTASFQLLKKGGFKVILFLILAIVLVALQNVIGVTLARLFNLNALIGLSTGSVPMTGGHGTSGAFAPLLEERGAIGASTVAMASATFGLICGSMLGGPVAKRLIEKNNLLASESVDVFSHPTEETTTEALVPKNFSLAAFQIILAMGIGTIISMLIQKTGLTFPSYIGAMFSAAIIRNISDLTHAYKVPSTEVDILGNISLSIFLSMALMGLRLWELADLAIPMLVMLVAQAVLMGIFAYFVTFNVMGKNYDAAVLAGGHCGFGMGATPNAIANMEAISSKYGPAPAAFFIIPLVGSLFIDFVNSGIILAFINLF